MKFKALQTMFYWVQSTCIILRALLGSLTKSASMAKSQAGHTLVLLDLVLKLSGCVLYQLWPTYSAHTYMYLGTYE